MTTTDARGHAVVMRRYGPPDVLVYVEAVLPALGPDKGRILLGAVKGGPAGDDPVPEAGDWGAR